MSAFLIFPHQLFEETLAQEADVFYVIESDLFFKQYAFHKQKILFHRASMRAFADRLRIAGKTVEYIEAQDPRAKRAKDAGSAMVALTALAGGVAWVVILIG